MSWWSLKGKQNDKSDEAGNDDEAISDFSHFAQCINGDMDGIKYYLAVLLEKSDKDSQYKKYVVGNIVDYCKFSPNLQKALQDFANSTDQTMAHLKVAANEILANVNTLKAKI